MEGKTVMMTVLLLSLVVGQIQVEAKSCCPNTTARNVYNVCRFTGGSRERCASLSGCKIVSGTCPPGYTNDTLQNTGDAINEYCKLGCAFSVCGAITTLKNLDDAGEVVNGAVEKCTMACSALCSKYSISTA
ncbi:thionin-like [Humulus lupulus]|uniref:thionin-like n=1 Tax=Humulus lupulus TaxID=3486 RepID=UPI002B409812|nr:thionin-like [Humulus lupulus]